MLKLVNIGYVGQSSRGADNAKAVADGLGVVLTAAMKSLSKKLENIGEPPLNPPTDDPGSPKPTQAPVSPKPEQPETPTQPKSNPPKSNKNKRRRND
ncbi:unnamed protein product [Oppiella nova]|uniref:Uncharacterized protein n=1 Tax=Oppiella nova TaxID=334625 RepID=A0A7R9M9R4_9ACAR|nr:unnamed protein product [Oppiella nova]CAG2173301.1 unnamed protein product [Oppiella nova]